MPDEFKGNLFYSDDTWWKQLKVESEHVTESSEISTRKEFQTALEDYFKNPSSTFDIPVIPGNKTATGIGGVEIVDGKPKRIKENPATMVSLLYLDFLVYEPTKIALDNFIPRMSKGSIIAFNTFNDNHYPGTTNAILDTLKINEMQIKRFSFSPYTQYITL